MQWLSAVCASINLLWLRLNVGNAELNNLAVKVPYSLVIILQKELFGSTTRVFRSGWSLQVRHRRVPVEEDAKERHGMKQEVKANMMLPPPVWMRNGLNMCNSVIDNV